MDTLRLCGGVHVQDMYGYCAGGGLGISATLNGVAISYLTPGDTGHLQLICFGFPPAGADYYVIVGGALQFCAITSDSNNHSVIYLDSASLAFHHTFTLERLSASNTWQTVTSFNRNSSLVFLDAAANTAANSQVYRLKSNYCYNSYSTILGTIYLRATGNTLAWNRYSGSYVTGYYVHKRDSNGNFALIDSVIYTSGTNNTLYYTDSILQFGDEYYVESFRDAGCRPTLGTPLIIRSNTLRIGCSLAVTATATSATCATCPDGSAAATVQYGTTPLTYLWTTSPLQTTQSVTGLISGNYTVCTIDANGCAACDTVFVDSTLIICDSCLVTVYDTTFVTVYDTNTIDIYLDTSNIVLYDTIDFYYDTIVVTEYDTAIVTIFDTTVLSVYDTIAVTDTLYIDIPTGLNPPDDIYTIKVYPNPTANQVYIDIAEYWLIPGYTLKLLNPLGQQVFTSPVNYPGFAFDLNMFGTNGVYILQFINSSQQVLIEKKIIAQ